VVKVSIDGIVREAQLDELLVDLIDRTAGSIPQVCYHPQPGPVQICDTCMVEAKWPLHSEFFPPLAHSRKHRAGMARGCRPANSPRDS